MARTRSGKRYDCSSSSSSSSKKLKETSDGTYVPWSSLCSDVLSVILMKLDFMSFFSFIGVCTSWRSCGMSNKDAVMASKEPMLLSIPRTNGNTCFLQESFGGKRNFKTFFPQFSGRVCLGLASGYMILYGENTQDFLLVNPVTRRELRFPAVASPVCWFQFRGILVFAPSLARYILVFTVRSSSRLSYALSGEAHWNHRFFDFSIVDIHAVDGRIYVLNGRGGVGELRFHDLGSRADLGYHARASVTVLNVKNVPAGMPFRSQELLSLGKKLFMVDFLEPTSRAAFMLDTDKLEWVSMERLTTDYALFLSKSKCCGLVDPKTWENPDKHLANVFYLTGSSFLRRSSFLYHWNAEHVREVISFRVQTRDGVHTNFWYFPSESYQEIHLLE